MSRERTRNDLIEAAEVLFAQNGYDATTIEAISIKAGVSRRTFSRYFESKEDLVVHFESEHFDATLRSLRARPPFEDMLTAMCSAIVDVVAVYDDKSARTFNRLQQAQLLIGATPALAARSRSLEIDRERQLSAALAQHGGSVDSDDLRPRVFTSIALAVARVGFDNWRRTLNDTPAPTCRAMVTAAYSAAGIELGAIEQRS